MRLRVTTDKHNKWMQLFDGEGKVKSTRPATNEEAWMFGELDSRIVENNALENRIRDLEADLEEARNRAGAAEEALSYSLEANRELESARENDRKQYEDIISNLRARVQDLKEELSENGF